MPLPEMAAIGGARHVDVVGGVQVIGGSVYQDRVRSAAIWQRRDVDSEWEPSTDFLPEFAGDPTGDSWVSQLVGASWGLMSVTFESPDEVDADGDPAQQSHSLISPDGQSWNELSLPGTDPFNWFLGMYIQGDHGLIAARLDDDDAPALTFFTTSDRGDTWASADVALFDERGASVADALWDDDGWFVVGSIGVDDEREPAVFVLDGDGSWASQPVEVTLPEDVPTNDVRLADVERLDPSTYVGIVDTGSGNATVTSTDGRSWQVERALSLNLVGEESATFRQLVPDVTNDRFMAVLGFDPPVWLNRTSVSTVRASGFEGVAQSIEGVVVHQGEFVFSLARQSDSPVTTAIWQSPDGREWRRTEVDTEHKSQSLATTGDALISYGETIDGAGMLRVYKSDWTAIGIGQLMGIPGVGRHTSIRTGQASGRSLFASRIAIDGVDRTTFGLIKPSGAFALQVFEVPSAQQSIPYAVCPELDSGAIVVLSRDSDGVGAFVEVWSDSSSPRLGHGELAGPGDWSNAVLFHCARLGAGLIATGSICSDETEFLVDDCEAMAWISSDGFLWHEHPQASAMRGLAQYVAWRVASAGDAAIFGTEFREGSEDSLVWLATADELLAVPVDDVFSVNRRAVGYVAINEGVVLIGTDLGLFSADLGYLIERTRRDAVESASTGGVADPTSTPVPPTSESVTPPSAESLELDPIPLTGSNGTSTAPRPAATVPAAPAPTAPPAAATPTPPPAPAPTPDGSTSNGTSSGEVIITTTVECVTTTDAATGAVSEVCSVVDG